MKRVWRWLIFIGLGLLLTACDDAYSGTLILDGTHGVNRGEHLDATVLMTGGHVAVAQGGRLSGPLYLLGGTVDVDGDITGEVNVLGGRLTLGPHGRVEGPVNVGGGDFQPMPEATILGEVTISRARVPDPAPLWATRSFAAQAVWIVLQSLSVAVLAWGAERFMPRPVARVAETLTHQTLVAVAIGLLGAVVCLALLVQMAFTIILIPVALLGLIGAVLAVVLGWVALGLLVGRVLARRLRMTQPARTAFLGTLVLMLALGLIGLIPIIGDPIAILIAVAGFGAVLLTRFGLRPFTPTTAVVWEPSPSRGV